MIRIVGCFDASQYPCLLTFDYYVVISFSAIDDGAVRYVLIRSAPTNLVELTISLDSMLLKGFVVPMTDQTYLRVPLDFSEVLVRKGLPIIELPDNVHFGGSNQLFAEINHEFFMALNDDLDFTDILFSEQRSVNQVIKHERVWFLISNDELIGIRVTSLSGAEKQCIKDHIARNKDRAIEAHVSLN